MLIGFHKESSAKLGSSYDSESPDTDLSINGYFDFSKTSTETSTGIQEISVELKEAKTAHEIFEISGYDFKAEIKFGLVRGKVTYNKIESKISNELTTTLVLSGRKIFNPEIITGEVSITKKGLSLLKNAERKKDFLPLRKVFGDTLITKAWRGTYISVVYQFKASTKQQAERISSSISASYTTSNASLNIFSEAKKIDENVEIELSFLHIGTNEDEKIIKLLELNSADIVGVKKIIANYLDSTTKENCTHVRFSGAKISLLAELIGCQNQFEKADSLLKLWGDYNERTYKYLNTLLQSLNNCDMILSISPEKLKPNAHSEVKQQWNQIEKAIAQIYTEYIGRDYYKSPTDIIELDKFSSWSKYIQGPIAKVEIWQRTELSASRGGPGCENFDFHNFYQKYYPIIKSDFTKSIRRLKLLLFMQPIASLDQEAIIDLDSRNGDFSTYYSSSYENINVYTWGINYYPGKWHEVESNFATSEQNRQYQLEITTDDGLIQLIDVGAYGRLKSDVITKLLDTSCLKHLINYIP